MYYQTWAFLVLARATKVKILARPARPRPKNPDFGAPNAPKMGIFYNLIFN